jgi:hypothetical protein
LLERVRGYAGNVYDPENIARENGGVLLVRGLTIRMCNCALFNSSGYGVLIRKSDNLPGTTAITGSLVIQNTVFIENVTHICCRSTTTSLVIQNCSFGRPSINSINYNMEYGFSIAITATVFSFKIENCTFGTALYSCIYMGANAIANHGYYQINNCLFNTCEKTPIFFSRIINTDIEICNNTFNQCCTTTDSADISDATNDPHTNLYNSTIMLCDYKCYSLLLNENRFIRQTVVNGMSSAVINLSTQVGHKVFIRDNIMDMPIKCGSNTLTIEDYVVNSVVYHVG